MRPLLVTRQVEVVELGAVVIADQAGHLLEVFWLELQPGGGTVTVRLLTPRHQRLAEETPDRLAPEQPQVARPRAQAEEIVGVGRSQPLKCERERRGIELFPNRDRRVRR